MPVTVSILTPTYNRAELLRHTARSVLAQTYADWEWIIMDDGSTDHTEEVVRSLHDQRISLYRLPHTGALTKIRNRALELSKGEYIALLDSDDLWKKDMLETAVNMLKKENKAGFVLADAEIVQDGSVIYPSIYGKEYKQRNKFYRELFTDRLFVIFPSALVLRRAVFEKVGKFDEQLKFGEKDLFTRMAWHVEGRITDQVLVTINRHGKNESSSAKLGSLAEESFKEELYTLDQFFNKGFIDRKFYREWTGKYYFKLAEFYYRGRFFKEAASAYRSSLSHRPLNAKAALKFLLSKIR